MTEENDATRSHWNEVYARRDADALSWFEAAPDRSVDRIVALAGPHDAVLDVGGGASRLPDSLLERGYDNVAVLDLSPAALAVSKHRLGARAGRIDWHVADVTRWCPPRRYAVWHDRAVFHFLTDPDDRRAYAATLKRALRPGGAAVIHSFAPTGPEACSGLPVRRYSPVSLAAEFERLLPGILRLEDAADYTHRTPGGAEQRFQLSVLRRGVA